jgi:DNA-directed RNA polymerase subunit alpha
MMNSPSFKIKTEKEDKNYARFILEPLEQGYGQTLGNSLRRCLLTSMPGAAITRVKIDSVKHQFSTLEGMKEDIVELILNIKQIRVIYKGTQEVKLSLKVTGVKEIKAGDIEVPAEVKIVNKDLVLAKLTDKKASLAVEMWVNVGYGYSPAEERKTTTLGMIPLDAAFAPITRVNYDVETTRVGRRTDLDKLILDIWTNGTIKPKDAVEEAAKVLVGYFQQVYNPKVEPEEEPKVELAENNEILKLTVEELNLPTRIANALRKSGYATVKDLTEATKKDIAKVKNLGGKSVDVIKQKLTEKGLTFRE